jgi:hypothetical protein
MFIPSRLTTASYRSQLWEARAPADWPGAALAPRSHSMGHGITLMISRLDKVEKRGSSQNDRQISWLHDLPRLFAGIPASVAD